MRRTLVACLIAALVVVGSAYAATPTLMGVGQQNRHPSATFGALTGVDAAFIYLAAKPDRASDGSFLDENVKASDSLTDDEIAGRSWLYETQVDPGMYYVLLRTFDFDCYQNPNCIEGFSNMLTLTIPKPAQRFSAKVELLRYVGVAYLTLNVIPLGDKLPYRVCWTLIRGSRCLRATVEGFSWNSPASDLRRVSLRRMRKVTTFSWYADGRRVASRRVRVRR